LHGASIQLFTRSECPSLRPSLPWQTQVPICRLTGH
jgi:hypothetical protein